MAPLHGVAVRYLSPVSTELGHYARTPSFASASQIPPLPPQTAEGTWEEIRHPPRVYEDATGICRSLKAMLVTEANTFCGTIPL